jgi:hypothetical protein
LKTCVVGRTILKQFCWQKSAEPCSASVAGGRRRRRRGWCWGLLVIWIFFLVIPNARLVSHSSLPLKTNSWLIFGITSHSKMSGLSVLVCGTMSVWCLAFMTRLPLVRNLSPYGNGFALLKALCPSHFRVYVVHSSLFYVENSMDHTDPSLETAHSCYSWCVEYFFFTLRLTENTMLGLTAQQPVKAGNGESPMFLLLRPKLYLSECAMFCSLHLY